MMQYAGNYLSGASKNAASLFSFAATGVKRFTHFHDLSQLLYLESPLLLVTEGIFETDRIT